MCYALCIFSYLVYITVLRLAIIIAFEITKLKFGEVEPLTHGYTVSLGTQVYLTANTLFLFTSHCHLKPYLEERIS